MANKLRHKTFDRHSAKFVAALIEAVGGDMSGDVMQGWIRNPLTLQVRLAQTLNPTFGGPVYNIVRVDHNKPFNHNAFFSEIGVEGEWSESGGDTRAPRVSELDLDTVIFGSSRKDLISLDAHAFRAIWELRFLLTSRWRTRINGCSGVITFGGTYFSSRGRLAVLGLSWVDGTGLDRPMDIWTAGLYTIDDLRDLGDRASSAFVPDPGT
jgi:hypothetical protein